MSKREDAAPEVVQAALNLLQAAARNCTELGLPKEDTAVPESCLLRLGLSAETLAEWEQQGWLARHSHGLHFHDVARANDADAGWLATLNLGPDAPKHQRIAYSSYLGGRSTQE